MGSKCLIMKVCPQCQSTYTDDTLQFCLQDGSFLSLAGSNTQQSATTFDEPETVVLGNNKPVRINIQEPKPTQPQINQTTQETDFYPQPEPKKSKTWLFVLLGLFLIVGLGGLGALAIWFFLNPGGSPVAQNININSSSNTNRLVNSEININTNVNANANAMTPTPKPTLKPAEMEAAKKEVETMVYGWKASAENINIEANLSNYADTVDYYKVGKVSRSKVKANKEPAYKKYDSIQIEIENMKVLPDPTGEKATVTFDKSWDFNGVDKDGNDVYNRGKVQQQLILNKIGGKWKIVSEKELKIYPVDKGNSKDEGDDY